jgi:hypothetical protein
LRSRKQEDGKDQGKDTEAADIFWDRKGGVSVALSLGVGSGCVGRSTVHELVCGCEAWEAQWISWVLLMILLVC